MKKYYTSAEVASGIENLPEISSTTLRNLRMKRKLKYTKIGGKCMYQKEWIEDYIRSNIVQVNTTII